ncbi:MAG TPA: alternative oxidase [Desulfatiglandales bacterium]|nr:alternative oxidase [Desulfatiglandales bacterium]
MIDLKKEQKASLARQRYQYSFIAKIFFFKMDILTGKKITLAKAKLLETLASIPYRVWELRQYGGLTRKYKDEAFVQKARKIMLWGREAQDNEYWHLLVINEKMKEDNVKDPWYLNPIVSFLMVSTYILMSRILAIFNISRAFLFNAEFEDHAEHVYARFVEDHPEWDTQPVNSSLVKEYGNFKTWGDVFRRIGLDERDHMNNSFVFCGKSECVVKYNGMPDLPKA